MVRVEIDSDAIFQQVMGTTKVQAKVNERAAKISGRIRRDLNRAGIDATVSIREYAHANGRYGVNVMGNASDEDSRKAKRIARRAGRSVRR